jgi:microcystin-dependent protein
MTQFEAAEYIKNIYRSRKEFDMLGTIQAVTRESLPNTMLLCDGSVYNKDDYPQLWEVLPLAMKDATTLTLPDLRNLFLVGAGMDYSLGDTGGVAEVLLTIDEIPSHSHTNAPHVHGESAAAPTANEISPGVPVPSAIPIASTTAPASIVIDPTGGDQAHENRPPYYAVVYAMIAKVIP